MDPADEKLDQVSESDLDEDGVDENKPSSLKLALIAIAVFVSAAIFTASLVLLRDARTIDTHFAAGNTSYDRAFSELEKSLQVLSDIKPDRGPDALDDASKRISKRIDKANGHLKKADAAFKKMKKAAGADDESRVAGLLISSVALAQDGTDELGQRISQLRLMASASGKIRTAADRFGAGFDKSNAAIKASNEDQFAEAKSFANESYRLFSQAKALLAQADESILDPSLGDLVTEIGRAQSWASGAEDMSDAGAAKQTRRYNQLAKDNNQLSDEVNKLAKTPTLVDPDSWVKEMLETFGLRIERSFELADRDRETALELWQN